MHDSEETPELRLRSLEYRKEDERFVLAYVASEGWNCGWNFITGRECTFQVEKGPRLGSQGPRHKAWRPGFESWLSVCPWVCVWPYPADPLFSHGSNGDPEIGLASVIRLLRGSERIQESACKVCHSIGLILSSNTLRNMCNHRALR